MSTLSIRFFGEFHVEAGERVLDDLFTGKMRELFAFLLLHRDQPHTRESLADILWGERLPARAKSYLRHALWRLHNAVDGPAGSEQQPVLLVDSTTVRIGPDADLWLDVHQFKQAFERTKGVAGDAFSEQEVHLMQEAVALYQEELLRDCYQDWCVYERECLNDMYLIMLDKLMAFCEAHRWYDDGLAYGAQILRHDLAREQTYQRLMRLQYLAGDRTGALRQFDRCLHALDKELGVQPSRNTITLYERIRADTLQPACSSSDQTRSGDPVSGLPDLLHRLHRLESVLAAAQHDVREEIDTVELALKVKQFPA